MGISLFGSTNMEWEEIERVNDPFSDEWQDNYCAGKGAAQDDAIKALEKDHAAMFQSIWR